MDTNRELEAILDLIPKHLIVRVREGGGPENIIASLAGSVQKLVRETEKLSPTITEVEITEKMCETGNRALYGERWLHMPEMQKATANHWMRDALTAVLTSKSV